MKVEKLMTSEVRSCRPEDSLNCAAQIMWERDCGCVPVTDEYSRLVGMVTDRDLCMAAYTKGGSLQDIRISDVMSAEIQCCSPRDGLSRAESQMQKAQVRRLPVCDSEKRLVGLLSLNDIARRAIQEEGKKRIPKGLDARAVSHTLAAVSAPRPVPAKV